MYWWLDKVIWVEVPFQKGNIITCACKSRYICNSLCSERQWKWTEWNWWWWLWWAWSDVSVVGNDHRMVSFACSLPRVYFVVIEFLVPQWSRMRLLWTTLSDSTLHLLERAREVSNHCIWYNKDNGKVRRVEGNLNSGALVVRF